MALFYNQATLNHNGVLSTSNITTGELIEDVTMVKTPVEATYRVGDRVPYVISIVNARNTAVNNVTIRDNLGAYQSPTGATLTPLTYVPGSIRYYVNGALQGIAPSVVEGPPLQISGVNLPANGNAMIVFDTEVNNYASPETGGTINNIATATSTDLITPLTADATVLAQNAANLSISKALSPTTVSENDQITYTFTIQNTGNVPVELTDATIITDSFDPILDPIAVQFNNQPWVEDTNYTYDETTGAFATLPNQITVPAARYTQDPTTGAYSITPGISTLTVTGTI